MLSLFRTIVGCCYLWMVGTVFLFLLPFVTTTLDPSFSSSSSSTTTAIQQGHQYLEAYVEQASKYHTTNSSSTPSDSSSSSILPPSSSPYGCWSWVLHQFVLLRDHSCTAALRGEGSKSLLALLITRCHFLTADRPFPSKQQDGKQEASSGGCYLDILHHPHLPHGIYHGKDNPCFQTFSHTTTTTSSTNTTSLLSRIWYGSLTQHHNHPTSSPDCEALQLFVAKQCTKQMTDTAFSAYLHALSHIDSICYYIESTRHAHFLHSVTAYTASIVDRLYNMTGLLSSDSDTILSQLSVFNDRFQHVSYTVHTNFGLVMEQLHGITAIIRATWRHAKIATGILQQFETLAFFLWWAILVTFLTTLNPLRKARLPLLLLCVARWGCLRLLRWVDLAGGNVPGTLAYHSLIFYTAFATILLVVRLRYRQPGADIHDALRNVERKLSILASHATPPALSFRLKGITRQLVEFACGAGSLNYLNLLDIAAADDDDEEYVPEDAHHTDESSDDSSDVEEEVSTETLQLLRDNQQEMESGGQRRCYLSLIRSHLREEEEEEEEEKERAEAQSGGDSDPGIPGVEGEFELPSRKAGILRRLWRWFRPRPALENDTPEEEDECTEVGEEEDESQEENLDTMECSTPPPKRSLLRCCAKRQAVVTAHKVEEEQDVQRPSYEWPPSLASASHTFLPSSAAGQVFGEHESVASYETALCDRHEPKRMTRLKPFRPVEASFALPPRRDNQMDFANENVKTEIVSNKEDFESRPLSQLLRPKFTAPGCARLVHNALCKPPVGFDDGGAGTHDYNSNK